MDKKLVFDVGGTLIKYALMSDDGEILEKGDFETPKNSQEDFLAALSDQFERYQDQVDGIAISIPGNVDSATGFVYTPGALYYNRNTPVADLLGQTILERTGKKIPVAIENDGKAAALAELWKGNLQDVDNGAVIIIGTGIGGGIIIDRKVVKGKNFFAGELSFLKTDFDDLSPESLLAWGASTNSLVKKTAQALGKDHHEMNGYEVFELIHQNHPDAVQAFDEVSSYLASQIYNLVCLLNPDRILIGGGISKQPILLENIKKHYQKQIDQLAQYQLVVPDVELDTVKFYNDSNLIGALYNYNQLFNKDLGN